MVSYHSTNILPVFEPRCEKMAKGLTFWIMYKRNCTIRIAETKALISWAGAKSRFSHNESKRKSNEQELGQSKGKSRS